MTLRGFHFFVFLSTYFVAVECSFDSAKVIFWSKRRLCSPWFVFSEPWNDLENNFLQFLSISIVNNGFSQVMLLIQVQSSTLFSFVVNASQIVAWDSDWLTPCFTVATDVDSGGGSPCVSAEQIGEFFLTYLGGRATKHSPPSSILSHLSSLNTLSAQR